MPVARTSFSASLLPILPAVTNPPEVRLFDLDDIGRAKHILPDLYELWRPSLSPPGSYAQRTLVSKQLDAPVCVEQFFNEISVESENLTSATWITYFLDAVTESDDRQDEIDTIPASYEDRYWLRRPIPVEFEDVAADAVIAHFHKADLAVTGSDRQDAKASLAFWILDMFDDLAAANPQELGRTPALQFRVLNEYINRRA